MPRRCRGIAVIRCYQDYTTPVKCQVVFWMWRATFGLVFAGYARGRAVRAAQWYGAVVSNVHDLHRLRRFLSPARDLVGIVQQGFHQCEKVCCVLT